MPRTTSIPTPATRAAKGGNQVSFGDFDLPRGDPARFQGLQTKLTETDFRAAQGFARHAAAVHLGKLEILWHQHTLIL